MHIYAFGSICRGEVQLDSDIDLLAVVAGYDQRLSPAVYSIYGYERIREIWAEGNPFAWHLHLEARLIYANDDVDFLKGLGAPSPYQNGLQDCEKFYALFKRSREALLTNRSSAVFDLSTVFLSIRNIATCFSLAVLEHPDFSRHSSRRLGARSLIIDDRSYEILERSRLLSTRGIGKRVTSEEVEAALLSFPKVEGWMIQRVEEAGRYAARIQQPDRSAEDHSSGLEREGLAN